MCDVRNYPKDFLCEFIDLYKSLPCLWKIKSKEYSDRNKKNAAYQKMVDKLKEVDSDANRDVVTKKINSLRSSYRKEKKKIQNSDKSGAGTEEVYTPSLWYFDMLQFLDDQETPRQPISNFDETLSQDSNSLYSPPEHRPVSTTDFLEELDSHPSSPDVSNMRPRRMNNKKRERDKEVDNVISSIGKRLTETMSEDRHEAFARNIAHKLRNMPSEQRIYLEKIINDATFEAELGNLNRYCYVHVPTTSRPNVSNIRQPLAQSVQLLSEIPVYSPQSQTITTNLEHQHNLGDVNQTGISEYIINYKPHV